MGANYCATAAKTGGVSSKYVESVSFCCGREGGGRMNDPGQWERAEI